MASEDVLERADEWLRGRVHFSNHATSSPARRREIRLVHDLAAEVRELRSLLSVSESGRKAERNLRINAEEESVELRKDKARLDELEKVIAMRRIVGGPWEGCLSNTRAISAHSLRDLADAAMGGEGGSNS